MAFTGFNRLWFERLKVYAGYGLTGFTGFGLKGLRLWLGSLVFTGFQAMVLWFVGDGLCSLGLAGCMLFFECRFLRFLVF